MSSIPEIENIILKSFKDEPFHTLYFYFNIRPKLNCLNGGTCSDKVLSVKKQLETKGIECYLHSSIINNLETHRLLKINVKDKFYFADVGNAWPSIKLFPANKEVTYTAFGITFYSIKKQNCLEIYQIKDGINRLMVTIPFVSKGEIEIMKDISERYDGDKTYPFSGKIRFAQVIDDSFVFLRDSTLHTYNSIEHRSENVTYQSKEELNKILIKYFNYDISQRLSIDCNNL